MAKSSSDFPASRPRRSNPAFACGQFKSGPGFSGAGAGCVIGRQLAFGPSSTACCSSGCRMPGIWIGAGPASTAPPLRRKGGCRGRPEPHGSWAKRGTKRLSVVDRRGTPLGVRLRPANGHDSLMLAPTLDPLPGVRPVVDVHASATASSAPTRPMAITAAGLNAGSAGSCRIARRGIDSSERLGRQRWVVERTLAWLNRPPG